MGRQDDDDEAAVFIGLAAAHYAVWSDAWYEARTYGDQAARVLRKYKLNEAERERCRQLARKRGREYLRKQLREGKISKEDVEA